MEDGVEGRAISGFHCLPRSSPCICARGKVLTSLKLLTVTRKSPKHCHGIFECGNGRKIPIILESLPTYLLRPLPVYFCILQVAFFTHHRCSHQTILCCQRQGVRSSNPVATTGNRVSRLLADPDSWLSLNKVSEWLIGHFGTLPEALPKRNE